MADINRRKIVATMMRGRSKEPILVRYFMYFDTAMPRMTQLAISYANEGDFVSFVSADLGIELGILRIKSNNRFEMEMSPIVKSSPSLLKLMSSDNPLPV